MRSGCPSGAEVCWEKISKKVRIHSKSWGTDRHKVLGKHSRNSHQSWRDWEMETDKQDQTPNHQSFVRNNLYIFSTTAAVWSESDCWLQDWMKYSGAKQGTAQGAATASWRKRPVGLYPSNFSWECLLSQGRSEMLRGQKGGLRGKKVQEAGNKTGGESAKSTAQLALWPTISYRGRTKGSQHKISLEEMTQ